MSAAPLLKVIDGGLSVIEEVPELPHPGDGDRLYPTLSPGGAGAFVHVVAVSLILHGALIVGSVAWNPFGEERAAGGLDELLVIEGVNVLLLDQLPSVPAPLAEANEIETADTAEPVTETQVAAAVEPAKGASPIAGEAVPVGADSAMEVAAEAAELRGEAAAANDEAAVAAQPDWAEADAVEDSPPTVATAVPVEAEDPDAALTSAEDRLSASNAERAAETAPETPPGQTETDVTAVPPEPEVETAEDAIGPVPPEATTAEIVPEEIVKPVEETVAAAASEILQEPPAEIVEAPKAPAKKKAASLPNPSSPSSEANPTARGPTKGKAGAGGTNPKAQGKASLSSYQSKLVAHLRRYRSYPAAARAKRLKGTAVVSFTIDGGGRVVGVSLAKGTGYSVLDREAVAMVRRASPFPAIPSGMGKSRVTVRAPVRFEMR